jgi:hypothetical protein
VADDILSLKGQTFAVNRVSAGILSDNRSRKAVNKQLPLFQEQAYAWFFRELLDLHVAWF